MSSLVHSAKRSMTLANALERETEVNICAWILCKRVAPTHPTAALTQAHRRGAKSRSGVSRYMHTYEYIVAVKVTCRRASVSLSLFKHMPCAYAIDRHGPRERLGIGYIRGRGGSRSRRHA